MSGIHYNVEAVETFCCNLASRQEAIHERLADERHLYETVFDSWRDHRAQGVKERLEELRRTIELLDSDLSDLVSALRIQMQSAQEYLDGPDGW